MPRQKRKPRSRLSLDLPKSVRDRLERIADREDRSLTDVVRCALEFYDSEHPESPNNRPH